VTSTTANGHYRRRWRAAGLSALAVVLVLGAVVFRLLGESDRIDRANDVQDVRIDANLANIERILQAGCAADLDFVRLPAKAVEVSHRPPSPVLVEIARDSLAEFLGKGCPAAVNPRTGRPFGPPPEVRTR
jgi:hypothetical protein